MNCCKKKNEKLTQLSKVFLYDDPSTSNLSLEELGDYLKYKLSNIDIQLRDEFFTYHLRLEHTKVNSDERDIQSETVSKLALNLVNTKIRDLNDPKKTISPLSGEISFEERLLREPSKSVFGIFYDGYRLHDVFQESLPESELAQSICHIIFTPRLFGTFDENDRRYHARVILCGYPSIISTTGIVDAPAKPKEYYKIKHGLLRQNLATVEDFIPKELKKKYLKYDDQKLTEVLKGYVMQVIFYHLVGEPFCKEPGCRLYNAHWQEELLQAQLTDPEFCSQHEKFLDEFNKKS